MNKMKLILGLLMIVGSLRAQYVPNSWSLLNTTGNFQNGRYFAAYFTIGNSIFVGTGSNGSAITSDFWEFNTTTNTWTQRNPFPGAARVDAVGFSLNGKGYIGGGINGNVNFKDFYQYDPISGNWAAAGTLPQTATATSNSSSFVLNYNGKDYAYICGGYNYNGANYTFTNAVYQYDPIAGSWSTKSNYPNSRCQTVAFVLNNIAYVGMGGDIANPTSTSFYKYNPNTDQWSVAPSMPGVGRNAGICFAIGNSAYVGLAADKNLYQFDGSTETWNTNVNNVAQYPGQAIGGCIGVSILGNPSYGYVGLGANPYNTNIYRYSPDPKYPSSSFIGILNNNEFNLYPNPFINEININSTKPINEIQVVNIFGESLLKYEVANQYKDINFNLEDLKSGVYFLIIDGVQRIKIVKSQ